MTELSERTGISKSYLSNIERNLKQNPSIHVIEKIAAVLKVDLKMLLKISGEGEIKQQLDKEWMEFISDLKRSGIDKERIHEYKIVMEFVKWQNDKRLLEKGSEKNGLASPDPMFVNENEIVRWEEL